MHYFKLVGKPTYENCKYLWENKEALERYLKRLKELMEEDEKPKENATFIKINYHEEINSRPK